MSKAAMMPEYKEVLISDLFIPKNGSSTYTKEWCQEHQGEIPLFSGNTFGPFDHINVADYDGEYITWAKDGLAGYTMYHNGKFSLTGHRGILIPKGDHSKLDVQYLRLMIEPVFRKNIKGRLGINGKNEYTTLNSVMINGITEKIKIPVTPEGAYDLVAGSAGGDVEVGYHLAPPSSHRGWLMRWAICPALQGCALRC